MAHACYRAFRLCALRDSAVKIRPTTPARDPPRPRRRPNHQDVAIRLNNLARLLEDTDRLSEAEPLLRRAVGILESSLGPEHPNTATVRKNLESLLASMNNVP
jgi:Tetratricopeptide repeat